MLKNIICVPLGIVHVMVVLNIMNIINLYQELCFILFTGFICLFCYLFNRVNFIICLMNQAKHQLSWSLVIRHGRISEETDHWPAIYPVSCEGIYRVLK